MMTLWITPSRASRRIWAQERPALIDTGGLFQKDMALPYFQVMFSSQIEAGFYLSFLRCPVFPAGPC